MIVPHAANRAGGQCPPPPGDFKGEGQRIRSAGFGKAKFKPSINFDIEYLVIPDEAQPRSGIHA
jgi:hypothetical protein